MAQTIQLRDRLSQELRTITVDTTLVIGSTDKNPTSATMLFYDANIPVTGTASAGSTTTLTDTSRTEANDYWNGLPIKITDATDDKVYETEVTDFDAAIDTLTFGVIPITVASGDTYEIMGTPVLTRAAATISGNDISRTGTQSDVFARPRDLLVVVEATFSATDIQKCVAILNVVPSRTPV